MVAASPPPLRRVIVPGDLISAFVNASADNTRNGIETMALLCGKVVEVENEDNGDNGAGNGAGFVGGTAIDLSHLMIPPQIGDVATVEITNIENVHANLEQRELLVFGWIHTHPTFRNFLSGTDLHSCYQWQRECAEAIAIVVSGRGVSKAKTYALTAEGMHAIARCKKSGQHRSHPDSTYYEVQHTVVDSRARIVVIDHR